MNVSQRHSTERKLAQQPPRPLADGCFTKIAQALLVHEGLLVIKMLQESLSFYSPQLSAAASNFVADIGGELDE